MIFYDEDAFFGSGEYDILTVSEVLENLNKEESRVFLRLCRVAEKRKTRKELFKRGYKEARTMTNNYEGHKHHYHRSRSRRRGRAYTYDEYDYDSFGLDASMFY